MAKAMPRRPPLPYEEPASVRSSSQGRTLLKTGSENDAKERVKHPEGETHQQNHLRVADVKIAADRADEQEQNSAIDHRHDVRQCEQSEYVPSASWFWIGCLFLCLRREVHLGFALIARPPYAIKVSGDQWFWLASAADSSGVWMKRNVTNRITPGAIPGFV